jgi:prepilin-type N-terminal cleavage/methylation domain-containing protein
MKNKSGVSLIETVIALAILGIILGAYFEGLNVSLRVLARTDQRQMAKSLAGSQMEYVKEQPYAVSYSPSPISREYAGYSVAIYVDNISSRDANIQKIRVVVNHQGRAIIMVQNSTLEGYKVNR